MRYIHIAADPENADDPAHADYVQGDPNLSSDSMDYVLVDGYYRDECARRAVELVKPGGLLIVDNANWFIPHPTRSPASASNVASAVWGQFLSRVADWRMIWTSNGVSDTALWFRTS